MEKKQLVKNIFDSIAFRYDFLNRLLSFGIDIYWRNKALKISGINNKSKLLDLACGTGDFAIAAKKFGAGEIIGADFSHNMLSHFTKKAEWSNGLIIQAAAEALPFQSGSFTNITVAFGVRNFHNLNSAFNEFYRVISESGKVTILEFTLPENKFIRAMYLFYFNKLLPFIGGAVSGNKAAYKYLPESVKDFDESVDLTALFFKSGFKNVKRHLLTFGICAVTIGEK